MGNFYFSGRVWYVLKQRMANKTFREIGAVLGITGERVRQIFRKSGFEIQRYSKRMAYKLALDDFKERELFAGALTLCIMNGGFPANLYYSLAVQNKMSFEETERRLEIIVSKCRGTAGFPEFNPGCGISMSGEPGCAAFFQGLAEYACRDLTPE